MLLPYFLVERTLGYISDKSKEGDFQRCERVGERESDREREDIT